MVRRAHFGYDYHLVEINHNIIEIWNRPIHLNCLIIKAPSDYMHFVELKISFVRLFLIFYRYKSNRSFYEDTRLSRSFVYVEKLGFQG